MAISLSIDELLRYSVEEREKWRAWLLVHPDALAAPVQPGGRFVTVGQLIDHIFLVERRHVQRLEGAPVSDSTGLTALNVPPLFDYGGSVRRELERLLRDLTEEEANEPRRIIVREQEWTMSSRKLLFHMLIHEIRHWAQITLAVRLAGLQPPGDHDLFFSRALQ